MKYLLALALASCTTSATAPQPAANPYVASIDVTCFFFAVQRAENEQQALELHNKCAQFLVTAFAKKVNP